MSGSTKESRLYCDSRSSRVTSDFRTERGKDGRREGGRGGERERERERERE
jgi:hypothetical protein